MQNFLIWRMDCNITPPWNTGQMYYSPGIKRILNIQQFLYWQLGNFYYSDNSHPSSPVSQPWFQEEPGFVKLGFHRGDCDAHVPGDLIVFLSVVVFSFDDLFAFGWQIVDFLFQKICLKTEYFIFFRRGHLRLAVSANEFLFLPAIWERQLRIIWYKTWPMACR